MELDLETDEQIRNRFQDISKEIAVTGQNFYDHGWVFGTSGNLSAVVSDEPSLLAITGSGLDKGNLSSEKIILIDREMKVIWGNYRPSAETALHLTLVQEKSCKAVFHTHSIWSTILSQKYEKDGGIWIEGLEMLKSLDGVKTHEHREWIPILKNSQDMDELAIRLKEMLNQTPNIHGFMLSGHGLYTWGKTIQEAKRHVEGIEFILEVHGRMDSLKPK